MNNDTNTTVATETFVPLDDMPNAMYKRAEARAAGLGMTLEGYVRRLVDIDRTRRVLPPTEVEFDALIAAGR
jgi:hypothetical protein